MWQPDITFKMQTHLPGGVAPSRYDLALDAYLRKREAQRALIREAAGPSPALTALRSAFAKFVSAIAKLFKAISRLFRARDFVGQPRPSLSRAS